MKRFSFLLIFTILYFQVFPQNVLEFNLNWKTKILYKNAKKTKIFTFSEAFYNNDFVPYVLKVVDVENVRENSDVKVSVLQIKKSVLNEEQKNQYLSFGYLKKDFAIKANLFFARKQPKLVVRFYPVFFENGNWYKIDYLKLKVDFEQRKTKDFFVKNQSVLSNGKWVKIGIVEDGVYKITFDQLRNLGFSNPEQVRVFGNDFGQLSYWNKDSFPDDLIENKIFYGSDYILFYAKSPHIWYYDDDKQMFVRKTHNYSDTAYYFLTDKNTGFDNRISSYQISDDANQSFDYYDFFDIVENDEINILNSGRIWLGNSFGINTTQTFTFNVENPLLNSEAKINFALVGKSLIPSSFSVSYPNGSETVSISSSYEEDYKKYADYQQRQVSFNLNSSSVSITITYNKPTASADGWLDYLVLNAKRYLYFNGKQLIFRNLESVGDGNVSEFIVRNISADVLVWDITNPTQPVKVIYENLGNNLKFKAETDTLREFVVFNLNSCLTPIFEGNSIGDVSNQNLHGISSVDMLIIANPVFYETAQQLAQYHNQHDGLACATVSTQQIYNEFSCGMPDVSAIRNFVRFVYQKSGYRLKYVLLVGDGSYKNKCPNPFECSNFVLTYQTLNSFNDNGYLSLVSDDFFGLLDFNEGETEGLLDVAVGRLPVKSVEELNGVIEKIKIYQSSQSFGNWRNIITLIADDEENNAFMQDAEALSYKIDTSFPYFNIKKIYLDAYKQEISASGEAYPEVTNAINNRVENGTLVMVYLGHGNQFLLAHEHVLLIQDIEQWRNLDKLMFFITGTCEFGKFDAYKPYEPRYKTSAGEASVLNSQGGAIGILTTARASYIPINAQITSAFFNYLFSETIGKSFMDTKNDIASYDVRNFILLADPAVRLQYPYFDIRLTKINSKEVQNFSDTLRALDFVQVEGEVINQNEQLLADFNGLLNLDFFDKKQFLQTLNNDGVGAFNYWTQNNSLFRGAVSVSNGKFKVEFYIPKDIIYNYGKAKFSLYAYSDDFDAKGYFNDVVLGGINENAISDKEGPKIRLFMNDTNFVDGGMTDQNPTLLALLYDDYGINTSSSGFGHDISVVLDNKPDQTFILNEFYQADLNTYKSGKVKFNFYDLDLGEHFLIFKAWDIFNNPSEARLSFVVVNADDLKISHLLNYPNPFTTSTDFYFEYNYPGVPLQVLIQIFTVSGKLVKTINTQINTDGFRSPPIHWDGLDDFGNKIGKGVYIYRVKIMTPDGKTAEAYEKLLILQ